MHTRKYKRIAREYRIEYGPFSAIFSASSFKATKVKNLSGGGVLFSADEAFDIGTKLVLVIHIGGWKLENNCCIPSEDHGTELQLKAIAEIVRVEHDLKTGIYRTGARFVGRLY